MSRRKLTDDCEASLDDLMVEAAQRRKLAKATGPLARFVEPVQMPAARSGKLTLTPKRLAETNIEFLLVAKDGQRLIFAGPCPRCSGENVIIVEGTYRDGRTTVEPAPHLCTGCETRLDEALAGGKPVGRQNPGAAIVGRYVKALAEG